MSIKVPQQTVEYQSHHHCQCDFCQSRRSVNAKKFTASQRALMLKHAQHRTGCCCTCHDAVNSKTFSKDRNHTDFDPRYPSPVNQTALNAARGRNGVPEGNQYTIAEDGHGMRRSGPGGAGGPHVTVPKTKDEEAKDAMDELDRLERLLIMEHKARVEASLEADKLGTLRTFKKENRPQPLPPGYMTNNGMGSVPGNGTGNTFGGSNYRGDSTYPGALGEGVDLPTIREAYVLAHDCPVTPPPQCRASHRLQDTINDVRFVTMDPVSTENRSALKRVLHANGLAPSPDDEYNGAAGRGSGDKSKKDGESYEFGNSLARNRTSNKHPEGAGVVWVSKGDINQNSNTETATAAPPVLRPGAVAAMRQENADSKKKVTYAI